MMPVSAICGSKIIAEQLLQCDEGEPLQNEAHISCDDFIPTAVVAIMSRAIIAGQLFLPGRMEADPENLDFAKIIRIVVIERNP